MHERAKINVYKEINYPFNAANSISKSTAIPVSRSNLKEEKLEYQTLICYKIISDKRILTTPGLLGHDRLKLRDYKEQLYITFLEIVMRKVNI